MNIKFIGNGVNNNNTIELFLTELERLQKEYDITIGGCGCCGSPFLQTGDGNIIAERLEYNDNTHKYELQGFKRI